MRASIRTPLWTLAIVGAAALISCDRPVLPAAPKSSDRPDAVAEGRSGPASNVPVSDVRSKPWTCAGCGYLAGPDHSCGRTHWCRSCSRDAGEEHLCGKSDYCVTCRREIGESHRCGETTICRKCRVNSRVQEGGPNHICNKTQFCTRCGVDGFPREHDCTLKTYACPRCEREATTDDHVCGKTYFCSDCRRGASVPVICTRHFPIPNSKCPDCLLIHQCGNTAYCPTCKSEQPLQHEH